MKFKVGDYITHKDNHDRFIGKILESYGKGFFKVLFLDRRPELQFSKNYMSKWILRERNIHADEGRGDSGFMVTDNRSLRRSTKKEIKIFEDAFPEYLMKKIGGE